MPAPRHRSQGYEVAIPALSVDKQNVTLGILMMVLGFFLFAANDAVGKWLLGTFTVGQLLFVRSIVGMCVIAPMVVRGGLTPIRTQPKLWLQVLRGVLQTLESAMFFWALTFLPLATVMTYYLAGPIYVTAMSPWLLGEHVGWRRWSAVIIGFGGVVLAIQPGGESLSFGALCALTGSFAYALFMVVTRRLAGTAGHVLVGWQLVTAFIFGGALVLTQGWTPPAGALDWTLLVVLGLGSLAGHWCVNLALKLAPASVVVPYQYTLIVWGILFGYLFFAEVSEVHTLLGAAIIIGAGLFIFLREQQLGRQKASTAKPSAG